MKPILEYTDILMETSCYLGYVWAADKFCKKYLGTSRSKEWLFLIFSFCGRLFLEILNRQYSIPYIFPVMSSHVFFTGLVYLLFHADAGKKFLAVSLLITVTTLVKNFCVSFLSCLALFFQHTVKKIPEPFLSEWEIELSVCVSFCLAIGTVYWMSKNLASVFCDKSERWYVTLAIPLFMIVALIDVVNWGAANGIMVKSGNNMGLYYDQIFSHTEICVLTGLSMFATGFYVFGMERIDLEQAKSSRYYSQITVYKMLEEQYRQSERLRHDMKNHIIALSGLFQSKEWEKMGDYLKQLEENGLEAGGDLTGNKAVDALLYQKQKWAERENIRWECDIQIPKTCCIHEFDLCVLFGNILDNALEACERQRIDEYRLIHIQAKTVKKCFLLEVKNSMDKAEKYTQGCINKENPKEHGIGLLNISDVVHRYNGVVKIEVENGIFMISVLIPLNDTAHDMKQVV